MKSKFVVDADKFSEALSSVARVIQSSTNSATYQCTMLILRGKKLFVRGTDLMTFVERTLAVEPAEDAADNVCLCVFETLFHFVRMSSGKLSVTLNDKGVELQTRTDRAVIRTRVPEEFASWPKWSEMTPVKCSGDILIKALDQAAVSASNNMLKPVLHSVSIKGSDVQSANGFRFQVIPYATNKAAKINILISLSSCLKLSGIGRPILEVGVSNNLLGVRSKYETDYFTLKEGAEEYPVFRQHGLPKRAYKAVIKLYGLKLVVEKLKGFVDKDYHKAEMSADSKGIVLTVNSPDSGSYTGKVAVVKAVGKPTKLWFDLLDVTTFLEQVTSETKTVVLELTDNGPYTLIDPKQTGLLYVAYPLVEAPKVNDEPK